MKTHETEYNNYFSGLTDIASKAVMFWAIATKFQHIVENEIKGYQETESFIDAIRISSNISFITQINKLLDNSGYSIYELVEFIDKYPLIFNNSKEKSMEISKVVREELKKHDCIIKKLKEHRNRFHAHLDTEDIKTSIYKVFSEIDVPFEELESLLISICVGIESLNSFQSDLFGDPYLSRFNHAREEIFKFLNLDIVLEKLKDNKK